MTDISSLPHIRRDYGLLTLDEKNILANPFAQFQIWFEEVTVTEKNDPSAMVLSTVDPEGYPDSRVVLLKGMDDEAFYFYTNYESIKAKQLSHTPFAALNFYWPEMARQVRVRGRVEKTSTTQSDDYFSSRPKESQLSALASQQSRSIPNREVLENSFAQLTERYAQQSIPRPDYWGGYCVKPIEFEFWQGRNNRLHDRICYFKQQATWQHQRLSP